MKKELYPFQLKLEIVQKSVIEYMHTTGASQQATAAFFNIPSIETVRHWKRAYNKQGEASPMNKRRGRNEMPKTNKSEASIKPKDLLVKNQKLRMENDCLKNCMPWSIANFRYV